LRGGKRFLVSRGGKEKSFFSLEKKGATPVWTKKGGGKMRLALDKTALVFLSRSGSSSIKEKEEKGGAPNPSAG